MEARAAFAVFKLSLQEIEPGLPSARRPIFPGALLSLVAPGAPHLSFTRMSLINM